jgi:hypothetical protein
MSAFPPDDQIGEWLESLARADRFRNLPNGQLAAEVLKATVEAQALAPVVDLLVATMERLNTMPVFRPPPTNLSMHDLENVGCALASGNTNFTVELLRLIAKADDANRERLRIAYPEAVSAWEQWMLSKDGA